ncbi:hypothetical protein [Paenibacillus sp. LHD-38]|uniref:hypothetical protein n=1 Tax=Paenibacillus sp. LHD-38 TaxID=3072143 RepID=UPI0028101FEB|nr:hypothetical protein [Paenibacillus sp. LHD-38]MDQ8739064.1 hypothetical protein [Paenibacillus sp. LHD-38]
MKNTITPQSAQKQAAVSQQPHSSPVSHPKQLASASTGGYTAAQLIQLQRTIGNGAARQLMKADASAKPIQRMTEADVPKTDAKKFKKLRELYGSKLGVFSQLYHYHDESFDRLLELADDLAALESSINALVIKAEKTKEIRTAKAAEEASAPKPEPKKAEESKTEAVSTPKKEKKKKPPKVNLAATLFTGAPKTVQQAVDIQKAASNPIIKTWIKGKPASATITEGSIEVKAETVYIYATVRIPDNSVPGMPQVNVYPIEIHYHPVPTSPNFLHVKRSAGSDAGNKVTNGSWLIPRGNNTLRDAVAAWNAAKPDNQSTHAW